MPLNKFIAHAGICSRRDAADVVKSGKVSVNGKVITEPGFKVTGSDDIKVQGKKISATKNLVYILLNKPKDHITTTEDPEGQKNSDGYCEEGNQRTSVSDWPTRPQHHRRTFANK